MIHPRLLRAGFALLILAACLASVQAAFAPSAGFWIALAAGWVWGGCGGLAGSLLGTLLPSRRD
ncbi:MAG: hypothetical protein KDA73_02645 [Rhodobacteraceae bacterium]|nr:hypothetical protein [Paracoccaceae bacterium]